MGQIEDAQKMDARFTVLALDAHVRKTRTDEGINQTICIECEEDIPEDRRAKVPGCVRCIECQEEYEDKESRRCKR